MRKRLACLLLVAFLISGRPLPAYSVLSHEQLIDIAWDSDIRPAILKRFPDATPDELKKAHAFAYGGSVIQDLGYYPFGNHFFTYLLHYVRTGDYVAFMLRDARDLNELAFALGALSHYAADIWGHPAINAGVAIEYPKLRARYGRMVTYEDNPEAHLKTEFSFDVLQVAERRYDSKQYHDFIGFQVSEDLLERAFHDTYGIKMDDVLRVDDLTLGTYRFSVSQVIPEMTKVALAYRQKKLPKERRDEARKEFLFNLSRADYEREFGSTYHRPGIFAKIIAFLIRLIPKFGPFKALTYKDPTPTTEDLYFKSMNNVVEEYHRLVQKVDAGDWHFENRNLDTGHPTQIGRYDLADAAYCELVRRLSDKHFAQMTPDLKRNILAFFAGGAVRNLKKTKWRATEKALAELKSGQIAAD
jgi:hypothetical protein